MEHHVQMMQTENDSGSMGPNDRQNGNPTTNG